MSEVGIQDLSITTFRPLGPRVTLTALASRSIPRRLRSRASDAKRTSPSNAPWPPGCHVSNVVGMLSARGRSNVVVSNFRSSALSVEMEPLSTIRKRVRINLLEHVLIGKVRTLRRNMPAELEAARHCAAASGLVERSSKSRRITGRLAP